MATKKATAKKPAKKPVKKPAAKKTAKAKKPAVKKTAKKPAAKKPVSKKTLNVKVVTDSKGSVTVRSVDEPGPTTEGVVVSVKPSLDKETGVLTMVPDQQ